MATSPSTSSSPSPADEVTSNDDLLIKILSRLPVRSLLRFMSVSKEWYILIRSPSFNMPNPDPPSGVFVPIQVDIMKREYEFVPFDIEDPVKPPFKILNFDPNVEIIDIEHSSNGLMLCHSEGLDFVQENMSHVFTHKYYVYNPTIDRFVTLPKFDNYDNSNPYGTFAYDPSKSPHYKIICVCGIGPGSFIGDTFYHIYIYSSETLSWKPSRRFTLDIGMNFRAGVYWNNTILWIHKRGYVLLFKLDEETIHKVQTPLGPVNLDDQTYSNYIFESRDHLLLVEIRRPLTSKFEIHALNTDCATWSLKYRVDLDDVGGSFPEIINPHKQGTFEFFILSVVLAENEDDSFMVLEIPWKALRFNLASRTFHKLRDFSVCRLDYQDIVYHEHFYCQFQASLYSF